MELISVSERPPERPTPTRVRRLVKGYVAIAVIAALFVMAFVQMIGPVEMAVVLVVSAIAAILVTKRVVSTTPADQ